MTRTGSRSSRSSRVRRRPGAVLAAVGPIAEQQAERHDVVLWDLAFVREAGQEYLRVAIDRPGGIDAEGLRVFAEDLSREIDAVDAVPGEQRYILEVTSPGAERRLRGAEQFRICRGRPVRVTFKDGRQPLEGTIGDVDEESVEVQRGEGESVRVAFVEISQARLSIPGV